jgi:formylmethanofuran dehydrogenase subunit B
MVAASESDCVLWISAYRASPPPYGGGPPVIALTSGDAALGSGPAVQIEVGRPGVDHDSVEHFPPLGTLVAVAATQRSEIVSVADAVGRIVAALPDAEAAR